MEHSEVWTPYSICGVLCEVGDHLAPFISALPNSAGLKMGLTWRRWFPTFPGGIRTVQSSSLRGGLLGAVIGHHGTPGCLRALEISRLRTWGGVVLRKEDLAFLWEGL